jgi:hypothetical protein
MTGAQMHCVCAVFLRQLQKRALFMMPFTRTQMQEINLHALGKKVFRRMLPMTR